MACNLYFKKNDNPAHLTASPGSGEAGDRDPSVPCGDGVCYHPNNSMLPLREDFRDPRVSLGFESLRLYPFGEGVGNTHTSESMERRVKAEGICVLGRAEPCTLQSQEGRDLPRGGGTS